MKRKIIRIDEKRCNGCGNCIPNCHEGALQLIDGKARLISDLFCDGLGACIGHCPQDAIIIEEREAEPYEEQRVLDENIIPKGIETIHAHLVHLREHGAEEYLEEALMHLKEKGIDIPAIGIGVSSNCATGSCPGSAEQHIAKDQNSKGSDRDQESMPTPSELSNWPIQLHLINPAAPLFKGKDVVIAADCSAFTLGSFHNSLLKGKALVIGCPKLDTGLESYTSKIRSLVQDAAVSSIQIVRMEVPCCGGLTRLVQKAADGAHREIPITETVISIKGEIIQ